MQWHKQANTYCTPLSSNEAKHWEKPADIVVVPSLYSRMWRCPQMGPPKAGYSGTNWTMPYPDMGEARAYWDRLRTTYCRGLEGSLEQSPKPHCPIMVIHHSFAVDREEFDRLFLALVEQPQYFQGRVVVAGIEANLPDRLRRLGSRFRSFDDLVREGAPTAFRARPLFLTVPYPTFELPSNATLAKTYGTGDNRDKLLSSSWGASCLSDLSKKKEKNSGGMRSALETYLHEHPDSSRPRPSAACELDQHAICVAGRACALPDRRDKMHRLAATSRYCLEPGGDTPTRSHFYVAAVFGCVPVLFEGGSVRYANQTTRWPWRGSRAGSGGADPGGGKLRYGDFSVVLRAEDVARDPAAVLRAVEQSDYHALRRNLFNAVPSLTYSNNHQTRDAFTVLEELVCAETGRASFETRTVAAAL